MDLIPAKDQGWSDLYGLANGLAQQWGRDAKAIDESRTGKPHIHLQLPGWGGAPGLPEPPAGFSALPQEGNPHTQPMSAAESKARAEHIPESYIEAARIKAVMHPHNTAPAPANLFAPPPMTPAQQLSNINRILAEGQGLPPEAPQQPRIGVAPAINAIARPIKVRISGDYDDGTAENAQYIGGFFDQLPQEVRQKLDTQQIEQYIALAKSKPSAQQLTDLFGGWGFDIHNADKVAAALAKGAKVSRSVDLRHEYRENADGAGGAFRRGLGDPVNLLDEMGAGFDTLGIGGSGENRPNIWNDKRSIGQIYDANVDANRAIIGGDETHHPYARLGGQLASGILLPYGAGARTPAALAKLGAAEGFVSGFGAGEGNPLERLPNAVVGAGFGSAGGYGIGKSIDLGGRVVGAARSLLSSTADASTLARNSAYSAAPVANDGLQAAGPTPAARFQPQGGVVGPFGPPAAMRMEDDAPELVGSVRQRDYINIPPPPPGFMPESGPMVRVEDVSRMMDVTEASQRLGPGDVMPPEGVGEDVLRVANITVSKIETPQDIRQALSAIQRTIGENPSLAHVSQEETARLAEQLGMSPADFLKRRQGQALNHVEAYALRNLHAAALNDTVARARKAIGGSNADKAEFLRSLTQTAALGDHASGAAAEAGRALGQYRMIAKATKGSQEAIRQLIEGKGGHRSVDDLANALIELEKDPGSASRFVQKVVKPGFRDKFNELYVNSLVSGPKTHAVNIISNLVTAGLQLPEHALAAGMGAFRRNSTDKVYFSELGPRLMGMLQGAKTGLRNAKVAIVTGRASDDAHKVESRFQHAIGGKKGHLARTPTRFLTAEDEVFKGMALGSELAGQAVRRAKSEGLRGDELAKRIAEINADPSAEMIEAGRDFARYVTFQRQLGTLGQAASRVANDVPGVKVLVPFVRTPTNLLKFAVERSPAAPLLKEWRADMAAGGARRDLATVRAGSGTALGLLAASWAAQGLITGGGPADDNARRIMQADGWQPYSIKIGDRYYSYARLDPLATTLGMAADYVDKSSKMTERQAEQYAATLTGTVMQNMSNKIWLSSLGDLAEALDDPERHGGAFVRKTLATMAVPVGVNQIAQAVDPAPREAKTVGEAIQARAPGLSHDLRPALDAWGTPREREDSGLSALVSPFPVSTPDNDPVNQEALRLDLKVSEPSRVVAGRRLSDEEFHAYRLKAGEFLRGEFSQLVSSPEWQALDDEQKRKRFDQLKREMRKEAREALGLAVGEEGKEVPIPSPPPGFSLAN
jgi:hypothetical protein